MFEFNQHGTLNLDLIAVRKFKVTFGISSFFFIGSINIAHIETNFLYPEEPKISCVNLNNCNCSNHK